MTTTTDVVLLFNQQNAVTRAYYSRVGEYWLKVEEDSKTDYSHTDEMAKAAGLHELWHHGLITAAEVAFAHDRKVCPPDCLKRFRDVVRYLLASGTKPTPKVLYEFGYADQTDYRNYSLKSGRYTVARRQEMLAAGWLFDEKTKRWCKT